MKVKNKATGTEADVPESLAAMLINAGGWESAEGKPAEPAEESKPVRKRAPRKAAG